MDIVRNKLIEMGFVLEKTGNEYFPDHIYKWKAECYRDATYYVWITSTSNWHFKIERAKSGHETGIGGYERYTCFQGFISSKSALSDLEVILRTTGALSSINKGKNILSS